MANILIVDDSDTVRDFLTIYLSQLGHIVISASTEKEAKMRLIDFNPDVILLDVRLNGENGREICGKIKSTTVSKYVYIILLSASPHLLQHYLECSADGVIEKPFDLETVSDKIDELMGIKVAVQN